MYLGHTTIKKEKKPEKKTRRRKQMRRVCHSCGGRNLVAVTRSLPSQG